jgi:hypothetical protein
VDVVGAGQWPVAGDADDVVHKSSTAVGNSRRVGEGVLHRASTGPPTGVVVAPLAAL